MCEVALAVTAARWPLRVTTEVPDGNRRRVAIVGNGGRGAVVDYETFLETEPVFTRSDLATYLGGQGVADPAVEARNLGEWWQEQGRVVAVRADVYAAVDDGGPPAGFQPWPYQVGTKLAPDAVLSHRSAVEYWGYSYTMWFEVVYSATRPAPDTSFGVMRYRGVRFPDRLVERGVQHVEVVEKDYAGGTVRVTTMERTLVDIMAAPHLGGDWDENWRTLSLADTYDLGKVAAYCDMLDAGPELRAKVGFFLDHNRHMWDFDDDALAPFRPRRPYPHKSYRLSPGTRRPRLTAADWHLEVPVYILRRAWEDFH